MNIKENTKTHNKQSHDNPKITQQTQNKHTTNTQQLYKNYATSIEIYI